MSYAREALSTSSAMKKNNDRTLSGRTASKVTQVDRPRLANNNSKRAVQQTREKGEELEETSEEQQGDPTEIR